MPGHETAFLIDTVGDALSKGVAATVAAQPADPVEYLAEWLLSHVKNEQQQAIQLEEKKQHIKKEKQRAAQALEEENEQKAAIQARKTAVDGLAAMTTDPLTLWQTAVRLVKMYTSAAAVYVANIVDDEQPDYASAEDPEADVETDDEAEHAAGATEGESAEGDPAADADETAGDEAADNTGSAADGSASNRNSSSTPVDYSSKLLRYVAASSGQEFMTKLELRRPKSGEDAEPAEGQKAEQTPVTFKILDDRMPLLEVPTVATEPRVKFLRGFPSIGGYCAAAVPAGSVGTAASAGAYQAVLAADTLLPDGHGQALTQEEVGFVWEVAQALGKALDAAATARRTDAARGGAADVLSGLAAAVADLRKAAGAPAAVPEVGEEPAAAEAEEGAEQLSPADRITQLESELQFAEQNIAAGKATAANAAAALELEKKVLGSIVQVITSVRGVSISALKLCSSSPPATFHVLRAVLLLLGREPASVVSWREASQPLNVGLFEELAAYDATQQRNMEVWKRVRAAYKGVQRPKDLEKELPQCGLGALLLQWIKQVRLVARKAAAHREADKALAAEEDAKAKKEQQLVEAKDSKAKADAEEAAAAAAAAAEEAAAAAAAAEAEEGGENADEEQ